MKIVQKQQNNIEFFELSGELDFHTSPEFREKLQDVIQRQIRQVIVNLKSVTYIDSSGLATFVEALQKIKRYNGKMVLTEMVPAVKSVFEIAKLDKVFTLASTNDEALQLAVS